MSEILVSGVSTRKYARALAAMAQAAGISKSALSRQFKVASQARHSALMERSFAKLDVLRVYIDGIQIAGQYVLATVELDGTGRKHLLGLARGASENARVVKDLFDSLVKRGIDASRQRLFVIDGGTELRLAIEEVYGSNRRFAERPLSATRFGGHRYDLTSCQQPNKLRMRDKGTSTK